MIHPSVQATAQTCAFVILLHTVRKIYLPILDARHVTSRILPVQVISGTSSFQPQFFTHSS